jgi:hypothetical protein
VSHHRVPGLGEPHRTVYYFVYRVVGSVSKTLTRTHPPVAPSGPAHREEKEMRMEEPVDEDGGERMDMREEAGYE